MRTSVLLFVFALSLVALSLVAGSGGAGAQNTAETEAIVGTWTATDPASGAQEQLVITADTLQFGAGEPAIPYTAERSGDSFAIFIGGPDNPATFTLLGGDRAELTIPGGGPAIPLARLAAAGPAPAPAPAAAPALGGQAGGQEGDGAQPGGPDGAGSLLDELTRAAVPYGVTTRYEPLKESLEALLSAGWKLDQAAGASGAFTLLLTNGASNVLCVLVPKDLGQADTALSDCRRLN